MKFTPGKKKPSVPKFAKNYLGKESNKFFFPKIYY